MMFLFKTLFKLLRIGFTGAQGLFLRYELNFLFKQQSGTEMLYPPAAAGDVALHPM